MAKLECSFRHVLGDFWFSLAVAAQSFEEQEHGWTCLVEDHLYESGQSGVSDKSSRMGGVVN